MRGGVRVIGYHGTSGQKAKKILRDGFKPSENDYDWLGTGVYFFEEDVGRAQRWALQQSPGDAAVLAAVINLGNVTDLFDHTVIANLRTLAESVDTSFRDAKRKLPSNKGPLRRFDCMLIDLYCDIAEQNGLPVPAVRGLFEEGDVIHPNSSIRDLTHIQLSVRDPRAILGVWSVRR